MTAAADEWLHLSPEGLGYWILGVGVFRLAVGPLPDVVSLAFAESEHSLGLIFCSASASLPLFAEVRLEGFRSLPPSP